MSVQLSLVLSLLHSHHTQTLEYTLALSQRQQHKGLPYGSSYRDVCNPNTEEILETKWSLTDYLLVCLGATFAFPDWFLIHHYIVCHLYKLIHTRSSALLSFTLLQFGRSSRRYLHSFGMVWSFQAAAYLESDGMRLNLLQKMPSLHLYCQKKKTKPLELCLGQAFRSLTWKLKIILGNLRPQLQCLLFSGGVRRTFGWFRMKNNLSDLEESVPVTVSVPCVFILFCILV